MSAPADRPPRIVLLPALLLVLGVTVLAPALAFPGFAWGTLLGTDPYMRLARVVDWHERAGWLDNTYPRIAAPEGGDLHWTRPLDVVLRGGALLLSPWLGFRDGLLLFSHLINPLCLLLAMAALEWGLRGRWPLPRRLLAAGGLALQPSVLSYTSAPRIDHHAALLLFTCVAFALLLRLAGAERGRRRRATLLGVACAFALWISFEFLTVLFFTAAGGFVLWAAGAADLRRTMRRFAVTLTVALGVFLFIERGPRALATWEIDRLSAMHLVLALAITAIACAVAAWRPRAAERSAAARCGLLAVVGLGVMGAVQLLFPDVWSAPARLVDPSIVPLWYSQVEEIQPLLRGGRVNPGVLGALVFAVVAVPVLVVRLRRDPRDSCWLLTALGAAIFIPLACYQQRHALFVAPFLVLPVVEVAWHVFWRIDRRWTGPARFGMQATLLTAAMAAPVLVTALEGLFPGGESGPTAGRPSRGERLAFLHWLGAPAGLGGRTRTVMADIDLGPMLVFETPHAVIGTPYHRNTASIRDGVTFFITPDAAEARAIARARRVDLVVLEAGSGAAPASFEARLRRGDPPAWLEAVVVPERFTRSYRVWRFVE